MSIQFTKTAFALFAVAASLLTVGMSDAHAVTKRYAPIYVENHTGSDLEYVTVIHKYSDVYKEKRTFSNLANSARSNDYLTASYHTGFGTTGKDWWQVTWKKKNDNRIYYTNPNNFRGFIDSIEKLAKKASGKVATENVAGLFFNSESTEGFKQHILRSKDENKTTVISIHNNTVKLSSPSGNSSTEGISFVMVEGALTSSLTCHSKLKQISYDYNGSKNWSDGNLNNICGPAENLEPAHCFDTVMHRGVNYGGGVHWDWGNAANLCKKTLNASQTVNCFKDSVQAIGWQNAIKRCQS